ncbi:MAG: hypothetical protein A2580_09065 [Hydrogenophilales bacterium RIFOXYD1_FULL_62_11]|nr:MAG: hypothetical protein A2580_09065 [Hydrogenophilales bacterium RIFOXYD1_FULL_62_11]
MNRPKYSGTAQDACDKQSARTMKDHGISEEFSLLGGPLHRMGCRLGLVRGGTHTIRLGLALGVIPWLILMVLVFIEGAGHQIFSPSVIGVHARLLLAIPLFFLCESLLDPRVAMFVRTLVRSEVVPPHARPTLAAEIARINRWKASWVPDAVSLLAAVVLSAFASQLHIAGTTAAYDPSRAATEMMMAGQWYLIVCLTLFRFLMIRWLWRLGLWCFFLWRVSRLDLQLTPTHPDGTAGLGYLEVVHAHFTPLILAISVVQAAMLAEELSSGTASFEAIYPAFALVLVVVAVLFLGPLFIFTPRLWACRVKGLSDYMVFGSGYVNGFNSKWLGAADPDREPLLGTADLQSLADLGNSISVVRNMRIVPISLLLLKDYALAALLPFLPLLLFKYPVADLAEKFFARLTGL